MATVGEVLAKCKRKMAPSKNIFKKNFLIQSAASVLIKMQVEDSVEAHKYVHKQLVKKGTPPSADFLMRTRKGLLSALKKEEQSVSEQLVSNTRATFSSFMRVQYGF